MRNRIEAKKRFLVTSVHSNNATEYTPSTEKKVSSVVKAAENLFKTVKTKDLGMFSINGKTIGFVTKDKIAINYNLPHTRKQINAISVCINNYE